MASQMPTTRRRLIITPSDSLWSAIDELHASTGKPKASIASEVLDSVAPVLLEQARLFKRLKETPEQARELLVEFGMHGINTISQQMLDLPPVQKKRGRPRKHAAP